MIINRSSFIVFCHDNNIKVKDAKSIWYLKHQIPSSQKVVRKVFKCPQINMYLVIYLNTSFWVFDQHWAWIMMSLLGPKLNHCWELVYGGPPTDQRPPWRVNTNRTNKYTKSSNGKCHNFIPTILKCLTVQICDISLDHCYYSLLWQLTSLTSSSLSSSSSHSTL